MTTLPCEKDGLSLPEPPGQKTAETSFIEGLPAGRVLNQDSFKIRVAHQKLEQKYPVYVKKGKTVTLEAAEDGKVVVVGPRGGRTPLFKSDGRTINPKIPKDVMKVFGPTRAELIQQKDEKIEELDKTMQEDTRVAN